MVGRTGWSRVGQATCQDVPALHAHGVRACCTAGSTMRLADASAPADVGCPSPAHLQVGAQHVHLVPLLLRSCERRLGCGQPLRLLRLALLLRLGGKTKEGLSKQANLQEGYALSICMHAGCAAAPGALGCPAAEPTCCCCAAFSSRSCQIFSSRDCNWRVQASNRSV